MKTDEEIKTEIGILKEMEPIVRCISDGGADHHAAMAAQVSVLERRMSEDSVWYKYGDANAGEYAKNVLDAALAANRWMKSDEANTPSKEWMVLLVGQLIIYSTKFMESFALKKMNMLKNIERMIWPWPVGRP